MSFTDSVSMAVQIPGGTPYSGTLTLVGNTEENVDAPVNANSQVEVDIQLIKANLQFLFLFCDQTITLKTNSSGAPQDTLNITANVPYVWTVNLVPIFACPFSNNVTKIFVNSTVNVAANFILRSVANN